MDITIMELYDTRIRFLAEYQYSANMIYPINKEIKKENEIKLSKMNKIKIKSQYKLN